MSPLQSTLSGLLKDHHGDRLHRLRHAGYQLRSYTHTWTRLASGAIKSGLVAASHHRPPTLHCHAQRRFSSSAAWASGMPPHPTVSDEPGERAPDNQGGRDDPRGGPRPRRARSRHPRRLGAATGTLHPDRLEITARQRRRGAPLLRQVIPLLDAPERIRLGIDHACAAPPAARRRHHHRRRRPPARTGLESASVGCLAEPARPLAPR
jgi:hypothetical protein